MSERQRRSFTEDYKRQAVELVLSSRRSVGSVARSSVYATRCCDAGWKFRQEPASAAWRPTNTDPKAADRQALHFLAVPRAGQ
jgi:transposase